MVAFTKKARETNIIMNSESIPFVSELKLLGVVIDQKLLFNSHVQYIIGKATRIFNKLSLYCRPTWGAHPENIQTIYRHVIEPIVTYASGIWGHAACKKGVKRKLLSMQRGFAIKAIKGFHTISTPAAIALAQFTPLDLKVREVHEIERTKLTYTSSYLPADITLERSTPPHKLLHPAERVTVSPRSFTSEEEVAAYLTPATTQIYTDGSKQEDGTVGAAFVCAQGGQITHTKKFKLHDSCSVFQAELFAIKKACLWAAEIIRRDRHKHFTFTILSDSMAALEAIKNRSNTHKLVTSIHKTLHTHSQNINMAWVRAHVGIAGNEAADSAAKAGTRLHKQPDYSDFPISHIKHRVRRNTRQIWQARYCSAAQGAWTRTLLPDLNSIKTFFQHTKHTFFTTQILTGHAYHKHYLHRFNITHNDHCPCDDTTSQTLTHLIKHCPRFGGPRLDHEIKCEMTRVDPYDLTSLMRKRSALQSFLKFTETIITALKRFNNT